MVEGRQAIEHDKPCDMTSLHIFVDEKSVEPILRWLTDKCAVSAGDIASSIHYTRDDGASSVALRLGILTVLLGELKQVAEEDDLIIAAGGDIDRKLASLFELGFHNVYNGCEMVRQTSAHVRFAQAASGLFVGPITPAAYDPGAAEALRFAREGLVAKRIPRHTQFIVNSLPKSGTIWLVGMLARILGVEPREQVVVSHVADMEVDRLKYNNHGSVTLVRDMRDVIVSWFHHATRTDVQLGFSRPRYKTIEEFYWEFFLGTMYSSDRYYRGDLCFWINRNCADYVPLIRYEDMRSNPLGALVKVLNAWRIDFDLEEAQQVCEEFSYERLAKVKPEGDDYVSTLFRLGHLRRGEVGGWETELPSEIARDIDHRFSAYQERLGYTPMRS